MNTIFISHFSRFPEVGAKVEQAVLRLPSMLFFDTQPV